MVLKAPNKHIVDLVSRLSRQIIIARVATGGLTKIHPSETD